MNLSDRIKEIVRYSGLNPSQYAQKIGTNTPQAIRDLMSGKTKSISTSIESKILSANPEISKIWLLTGEGEMLKNSEIESELETMDSDEEVSSRYITYEIPMAAMGGSLIGFDGEGVRREDCEKIISPIANIDWAVPVCGDSMEPEYPNGSKVFVRQINPRDFIAWGHVYVLDTTNGLIIKMVVESEKKDCVCCVSLNPSRRYAPFDVPMRSIRAMYRVLACVAIK